jgi:hypothetical protein
VPGGASPAVSPLVATTYYARTKNTLTGCVGTDCATVTVTINPPHPMDYDSDGDVDIDDCNRFVQCGSGPAIPLSAGCEKKDFDRDGDVDQTDFGLFQRCISGQDSPADPTCGS